MSDAPERVRSLSKRFYARAEVADAEAGYAVHLDGREVRTPRRLRLIVPARPIAEEIVREFEAQADRIVPALMPMTRLANSAIDTVAEAMDAVADEFAAYAGADLLCYRAEGPDALVARQAERWDPVLDWARRELGIRFVTVAGVMHHPQPDETLAVMRGEAASMDAFGLCALQTVTTLTGSAVLALALAKGALREDEAWSAANVDEDWQIEHWGRDAEAAEQRASRQRDFAAACRVLLALGERS